MNQPAPSEASEIVFLVRFLQCPADVAGSLNLSLVATAGLLMLWPWSVDKNGLDLGYGELEMC